jgi:hypothetical protein
LYVAGGGFQGNEQQGNGRFDKMKNAIFRFKSQIMIAGAPDGGDGFNIPVDPTLLPKRYPRIQKWWQERADGLKTSRPAVLATYGIEKVQTLGGHINYARSLPGQYLRAPFRWGNSSTAVDGVEDDPGVVNDNDSTQEFDIETTEPRSWKNLFQAGSWPRMRRNSNFVIRGLNRFSSSGESDKDPSPPALPKQKDTNVGESYWDILHPKWLVRRFATLLQTTNVPDPETPPLMPALRASPGDIFLPSSHKEDIGRVATPVQSRRASTVAVTTVELDDEMECYGDNSIEGDDISEIPRSTALSDAKCVAEVEGVATKDRTFQLFGHDISYPASFGTLPTTEQMTEYTKNGFGILEKGGHLGKLFAYETMTVVLMLSLTFLSLVVFWSNWHLEDTVRHSVDTNWQFWSTLYWIRCLYGLLSLPYVPFKIPGLNTLLTHTAKAGYDAKGNTRLSVKNKKQNPALDEDNQVAGEQVPPSYHYRPRERFL